MTDPFAFNPMYPFDDRSSTNGSGSSNPRNEPQIQVRDLSDDDDNSLPNNVQDDFISLVVESNKGKGSVKRPVLDADKGNRAPTQVRSRITVVCAECKRLKLKCDRRTPCSSCIKREVVQRCAYSAAASEKVDVQSVHNQTIGQRNLLLAICDLFGVKASETEMIMSAPAWPPSDDYVLPIDVEKLSSLLPSHVPGSASRPGPMINPGVVLVFDNLTSKLVPTDFESGLKVWTQALGWNSTPRLTLDRKTPTQDMGDTLKKCGELYGEGSQVTYKHFAQLPTNEWRDVLWNEAVGVMTLHFGVETHDRVKAMFEWASEEARRALSLSENLPPPKPAPTLALFAFGAAMYALGALSWERKRVQEEGPDARMEGDTTNDDVLSTTSSALAMPPPAAFMTPHAINTEKRPSTSSSGSSTYIPEHQALAENRRAFLPSKDFLPARFKSENLRAIATAALLAHKTFDVPPSLDFLHAHIIIWITLLHSPQLDPRIHPDIGIVVNVARTMGLGVVDDVPSEGMGVYEREMRRRCWWEICLYDSLVADTMGLAPTVEEERSGTNLPSDCDDAALKSVSTGLMPPLEEPGRNVSHFVAKCRLLQIAKQRRRDPSCSSSSVDLATTFAAKIHSFTNTLPTKLRVKFGRSDIESTFPGADIDDMHACDIAIAANSLLVRVWFPHPYSTELLEAANRVVIAASHMLIRFRPRPLVFGWLGFSRAVWAASMVLARGREGVATESARKGLELALGIFKDPVLSAPPEAIKILSHLVRGLPEERFQPGFKLPFTGTMIGQVSLGRQWSAAGSEHVVGGTGGDWVQPSSAASSIKETPSFGGGSEEVKKSKPKVAVRTRMKKHHVGQDASEGGGPGPIRRVRTVPSKDELRSSPSLRHGFSHSPHPSTSTRYPSPEVAPVPPIIQTDAPNPTFQPLVGAGYQPSVTPDLVFSHESTSSTSSHPGWDGQPQFVQPQLQHPQPHQLSPFGTPQMAFGAAPLPPTLMQNFSGGQTFQSDGGMYHQQVLPQQQQRTHQQQHHQQRGLDQAQIDFAWQAPKDEQIDPGHLSDSHSHRSWGGYGSGYGSDHYS